MPLQTRPLNLMAQTTRFASRECLDLWGRDDMKLYFGVKTTLNAPEFGTRMPNFQPYPCTRITLERFKR